MIASVIIIRFVGIPCARLAALAGKIAKASIGLGLMVYVGISILGYSYVRAFLMLAVLVGIEQGGTQA